MARYLYTLSPRDVGSTELRIACPCCGNIAIYSLSGSLGRVAQWDVGKRLFYDRATAVVSVESDAQRDRRLARENTA